MIIIAAMSNDRVIGRGNGMPWDVPDEYQQYLDFVDGNIVVMGRKSYEIFGRDLPDTSTPVVITRNASMEGVRTAGSLAEAMAIAEGLRGTVFVAGGESIYGQALPFANQMYLSTIKGDFDGDSHFPDFDVSKWEIVEERDEPQFVFRRYRRIESPPPIRPS